MEQSCESLIQAIRNRADDAELARYSEEIVTAARCSPPWDIQSSLATLAPTIPDCSDWQLVHVAHAVNELLAQDADPVGLCEPFLLRLPRLIERIKRAQLPEQGFISNDQEIGLLSPDDQPSWKAFAATWRPVVQTLGANAEMRGLASSWVEQLKLLIYVYEGAYRIAEILDVLNDARLLVIEPATERGFVIEMDGVTDNTQLQILLAARLVRNPNAGLLRGTKVSNAVESVAAGTGPQSMGGSFHPHWQLWKWTGIRDDLQLPAPEKETSSHWIWSEGTPKEIPEFAGFRVILLGPVPYRRSLGIQRKFETLAARVELVETLTSSEVRNWLHDMATSSDRPAEKESARVPAERSVCRPASTASTSEIVQAVLSLTAHADAPKSEVWHAVRQFETDMLDNEERNYVVRTLAPHIAESSNDVHAAIIATTCGALIESGADPAPLSEYLTARLELVLKRAGRLCDACLKRLPNDPSEQAFAAARSDLAVTMSAEFQAWESLADFYPPAMLILKPSPEFRHRMRSALPWASEIGRFHNHTYWLARCLSLVDDELAFVVEPETGKGFEIRLNGIDDLKQLLTLVLGKLVGSADGGWLEGPKPNDQAIQIAQGDGPEYGRGLIFSRWHTYRVSALQCWGDAAATDRRISNDSLAADLPKIEGHRIILLGPAPDWPRWRARRMFDTTRADVQLVRKLSASQTQNLLGRLKGAAAE